jgi:hypothetical protein
VVSGKRTTGLSFEGLACAMKCFISRLLNDPPSSTLMDGPCVNPLNAELNPICHLLVLLGYLTFMGPCIVSIFQCISNKVQRYTVYLYLETPLHVSDGTSTHHQERKQLYLQHLAFVHQQHTQTGSNSSTITADSSNGVTNTRCCRYSCLRS